LIFVICYYSNTAMMNKSFISLSISSQKLQVLQLNSGKDKVQKASTIDLPEGLISNHRVSDKQYLAKILKGVWKKVGLKEKTVGIVIPEFSTFIKQLTLPKLETVELDEAVQWQARDFLPTKVSNMSMDWKVVQRLSSNVMDADGIRDIIFLDGAHDLNEYICA